MKYIPVPVLLIIHTIYSFSQDCTDYHRFHCIYADETYIYSDLSKSSLFRKGQTSEMRIPVNAGEDYYIAVCAHRKFRDLHFKILEDSEDSTLIYDNAEHDYASSVTFTNDVGRDVIIIVSVPEGPEKGRIERRCVGVVIQYRKTNPEKENQQKNKRFWM